MATSEARVSRSSEVATVEAGRYRCTPGEDLVTALLAGCMVGGMLADAWAHTNIIETIESFFTPWHAMIYSGFTATAAWTFWLALRRRKTAPRWWRDGWPVGYAVGAVGAVGFTLGGLLDMVWHTIFGVEVSLDAAFSPSHLLIAFSALLLVTSPVRSWWAGGEGGLRAVAGVLALSLTPAFLGLLLTSFSAFTSANPTWTYDPVDSISSLDATLGMGNYFITTMVLVVPLLLAHRRRPTPGTATTIVAITSVSACIMYNLPGTLITAAIGAIAGAGLADLALMRADARRGRDAELRLPIAGALFAMLVWTGHLVGLHFAEGLHWPAELVAGSVMFSAAIGLALGSLAQTPHRTDVSV